MEEWKEYKESPWGKIPNNWGLSCVKDETDVVTDYVANGSFASLAENVKYKSEEDYAVLIRLVDYNNQYKGDFVFIDKDAYEFLGKSKLFGDEIIISNVGANVGTVFKCPHLKYKMSLAPNSIMVKFKGDNDFYYYWLKSRFGQHMLQSIVTGSAQPKFNKTNFRDMAIPVPPIEEQRQIGVVLKSLDDKIEVNRRINDNLEQQAQALFDKFLMNEELPRDRVLKDYAFINPTRSMKKGEVARYIDMSSLPTKGSFPSDWFDKPFNGGMKFQNGDTLMARITPCLENGKTAYINFLEKDEIAFGSTEYIVMSPHEGIPSEMFYFLARNDDFVSYAVAHMNGSSGRQRVSASDIENYTMPNIPSHLIEQFGLKANAIMETIKNNSLESRRLAELRDTLLPRLMSGELKVNDVI